MNSQRLSEADAVGARPIWLVGEQGLAAWLEMQTPAVRSWIRAQGFQGEKQKLLQIPTATGDGIAGAVLGLGLFAASAWQLGAARGLPRAGRRVAIQAINAGPPEDARLSATVVELLTKRWRGERGFRVVVAV